MEYGYLICDCGRVVGLDDTAASDAIYESWVDNGCDCCGSQNWEEESPEELCW